MLGLHLNQLSDYDTPTTIPFFLFSSKHGPSPKIIWSPRDLAVILERLHTWYLWSIIRVDLVDGRLDTKPWVVCLLQASAIMDIKFGFRDWLLDQLVGHEISCIGWQWNLNSDALWKWDSTGNLVSYCRWSTGNVYHKWNMLIISETWIKFWSYYFSGKKLTFSLDVIEKLFFRNLSSWSCKIVGNMSHTKWCYSCNNQ